MTNAKIRFHAMETGVKLYRVAAELGICDSSLSRKLRKELDEEDKMLMEREIRELVNNAVLTRISYDSTKYTVSVDVKFG